LPTEEEESIRGLVRCRLAFKKIEKRTKNRVFSASVRNVKISRKNLHPPDFSIIINQRDGFILWPG
jgi:hypothetical protein